jgi:hypothetical protein
MTSFSLKSAKSAIWRHSSMSSKLSCHLYHPAILPLNLIRSNTVARTQIRMKALAVLRFSVDWRTDTRPSCADRSLRREASVATVSAVNSHMVRMNWEPLTDIHVTRHNSAEHSTVEVSAPTGPAATSYTTSTRRGRRRPRKTTSSLLHRSECYLERQLLCWSLNCILYLYSNSYDGKYVSNNIDKYMETPLF